MCWFGEDALGRHPKFRQSPAGLAQFSQKRCFGLIFPLPQLEFQTHVGNTVTPAVSYSCLHQESGNISQKAKTYCSCPSPLVAHRRQKGAASQLTRRPCTDITYACVCVCIYIHTYVHMPISCVHIYIYTYAHTRLFGMHSAGP